MGKQLGRNRRVIGINFPDSRHAAIESYNSKNIEAHTKVKIMKRNRYSQFAHLFLLMPLFSQNAYAQDTDTVWTWVGVEVVTNDVDQIEKIRALAQLPMGFRATLSDPALPLACKNIRAAYPYSKISCQVISWDGAESLYVVEVDKKSNIASQAMSTCYKAVALDKGVLARLMNLKKADLNHFTKEQAPVNYEFIGKLQFLDSKDPEISALKNDLYQGLIGKAATLKRALRSCDPNTRSSAMYLLNFSGKPHFATGLAAKNMLDEDESMRNNAVRLLVSFHEFIAPALREKLQENACTLLENPSFTDRNKSLGLLGDFARSGIITSSSLSTRCVAKIREIRQTSISNQLGDTAGVLLKYLGEYRGFD